MKMTTIEFPGYGGCYVEVCLTATGATNLTRDEVGNLNSITEPTILVVAADCSGHKEVIQHVDQVQSIHDSLPQ